MFRITEAVSLAIRAMQGLAESPGVRVNAHDMAHRLVSSEAHLAKVLQALARANLVSSVRGPRGGFRLARPAGSISLLDIARAVEGKRMEPSFGLRGAGGRDEPCLLGRQLLKQREELASFMASTTLASCGGNPSPVAAGSPA